MHSFDVSHLSLKLVVNVMKDKGQSFLEGNTSANLILLLTCSKRTLVISTCESISSQKQGHVEHELFEYYF